MSKRWKVRKRNAALAEQHAARWENNRQRVNASFAKLIAQVKEQSGGEMKIPLEQAMEYGIGLRDVADCYADRCAFTLATEFTAMRLRAEKAEADNAALRAALEPERIIAAIELPGGHYCDPQAVADSIRAYCSTAIVAHGSRNP